MDNNFEQTKVSKPNIWNYIFCFFVFNMFTTILLSFIGKMLSDSKNNIDTTFKYLQFFKGISYFIIIFFLYYFYNRKMKKYKLAIGQNPPTFKEKITSFSQIIIYSFGILLLLSLIGIFLVFQACKFGGGC